VCMTLNVLPPPPMLSLITHSPWVTWPAPAMMFLTPEVYLSQTPPWWWLPEVIFGSQHNMSKNWFMDLQSFYPGPFSGNKCVFIVFSLVPLESYLQVSISLRVDSLEGDISGGSM
jgi:hypothetical protein